VIKDDLKKILNNLLDKPDIFDLLDFLKFLFLGKLSKKSEKSTGYYTNSVRHLRNLYDDDNINDLRKRISQSKKDIGNFNRKMFRRLYSYYCKLIFKYFNGLENEIEIENPKDKSKTKINKNKILDKLRHYQQSFILPILLDLNNYTDNFKISEYLDCIEFDNLFKFLHNLDENNPYKKLKNDFDDLNKELNNDILTKLYKFSITPAEIQKLMKTLFLYYFKNFVETLKELSNEKLELEDIEEFSDDLRILIKILQLLYLNKFEIFNNLNFIFPKQIFLTSYAKIFNNYISQKRINQESDKIKEKFEKSYISYSEIIYDLLPLIVLYKLELIKINDNDLDTIYNNILKNILKLDFNNQEKFSLSEIFFNENEIEKNNEKIIVYSIKNPSQIPDLELLLPQIKNLPINIDRDKFKIDENKLGKIKLKEKKKHQLVTLESSKPVFGHIEQFKIISNEIQIINSENNKEIKNKNLKINFNISVSDKSEFEQEYPIKDSNYLYYNELKEDLELRNRPQINSQEVKNKIVEFENKITELSNLKEEIKEEMKINYEILAKIHNLRTIIYKFFFNNEQIDIKSLNSEIYFDDIFKDRLIKLIENLNAHKTNKNFKEILGLIKDEETMYYERNRYLRMKLDKIKDHLYSIKKLNEKNKNINITNIDSNKKNKIKIEDYNLLINNIFNILKNKFKNNNEKNYLFKCGIILSKNLINKFSNCEIKSIQILPPKYPSRTCVANICLSSPYKSFLPKIFKDPGFRSLMNEFQSHFKQLGKEEIVLGVDDNRLNSYYVFSFSILSKNYNIKGSINDFIKINPTNNDQNFKNLKILISHLAGVKYYENKVNFIDKVLRLFFKLNKDKVYTKLVPSKDNIYKNEEKPIEFSDVLFSVVRYWELKRQKLMRISAGLKRLNRILYETKKQEYEKEYKIKLEKYNVKEVFKNDLINLAKLYRRKTEIYLLAKRYSNLRIAIKNYLLRSFFFILYIVRPKVVAIEKLNIRDKGATGWMALVTQGMFDDIKEFLQIIQEWFDQSDANQYKFEVIEVPPQYTSQICFEYNLKSKKDQISKNVYRINADYGFYYDKSFNINIIVLHFNASLNIALRGIKLKKGVIISAGFVTFFINDGNG